MKILSTRILANSILLLILLVYTSCNDYLDVVPDGVNRLENAFTMRAQAKKYLYTCYSYLPRHGNPSHDPAIMGGDELWTVETTDFALFTYNGVYIARGQQNSTTPLMNYWDNMYLAIRDCNIFLENVASVPDLEPWERDYWIGEVKFLKAYYHFYLVQMYGAVPIVRDNLPIDVDENEARVFRDPVDECFTYIVQLLDEAIQLLPPTIVNKMDEMGRINQAIALSLKAKVLVTAASPLYNGNTDQATLYSGNGTHLFNQAKSVEKWSLAVEACKEAIEFCEQIGIKLYVYPGNAQYALTDTIKTQMSLRNAFSEKWNEEIIWGNSQSLIAEASVRAAYPRIDTRYADSPMPRQSYGIPLKIAETFYSQNGVPINEDKTWDYSHRYDLRTAITTEQLYVKTGETTVNLHFDREPRFYAWVGFDCGMWYGQGFYNDKKVSELFYVANRMGQLAGKTGPEFGPVTTYSPKKYVHFENIQNSVSSYTIKTYAWPVIRLADLYLLYAEALNEAIDSETNRTTALGFLNRVRQRAGLLTVEESWDNFSINPEKYKSQTGLRRIIQQERLIELSFEGQRFWDIRRWKTAPDLYGPIEGWDYNQSQAVYFYRKTVLANQQFRLKDYFWPISNANITADKNLVQNIGW